jgi:4-diphosphocytidyl-2-C-methyl-D-erythritol kinase
MPDSARVSRRAPAKINLGLHVLRKRSDGYHDIETVFHRIDWADTVSVEPADEVVMTCSDPSLPVDEGNLCVQAALALKDAAGVSEGVQIHLKKRVPYGAGLGGGSSDAAATLLLLSDMWLDADAAGAMPRAEVHALLHDVGAAVGSDVPFFLKGATAAYATGRGEQLAPLPSQVGGEEGFHLPHDVVVVVPPVQVSTPDAYRRVTPDDQHRPDLRKVVRSLDLARWRRALVNDFEMPIMDAFPEIGDVRELLVEAGASYVSLTGSGSAMYGVFETRDTAKAAVQLAKAKGYTVGRG